MKKGPSISPSPSLPSPLFLNIRSTEVSPPPPLLAVSYCRSLRPFLSFSDSELLFSFILLSPAYKHAFVLTY